jgi:hypothetical protein
MSTDSSSLVETYKYFRETFCFHLQGKTETAASSKTLERSIGLHGIIYIYRIQ